MSSLLTFGILQQTKNNQIIWRGLEYKTVVSSTGETWLDRNLGATRVATSSTDSAAYGYWFQWGRYWDGHEVRTSSTTSTKATTAVPNLGNVWDGLYIKGVDWLVTSDQSLWQGINGTNNPCPPGFRIPTLTEWQAEDNTFSPNTSTGAFNSPLKLTLNGYRFYSTGAASYVGSRGAYWSSYGFSSSAVTLFITTSSVGTTNFYRASTAAVRCICDAC